MDYRALLRFYALSYFRLGFNVTCLTTGPASGGLLGRPSKTAPPGWEHLKNERQSFERLSSYDWGSAIGVGVVLGYNDYRVLDIDQCSSEEFIRLVLTILELPANYDWVVRSGSHDGFHVHLASADPEFSSVGGRVRAFLPNKDFKGVFERIEFRWQNHVVMPPSLHSSSNRYEFVYAGIPRKPPSTVPAQKLHSLLGRIAAQSIDAAAVCREKPSCLRIEAPENDEDLEALQNDDWAFDDLVAAPHPPYFTGNPSEEDFLQVEEWGGSQSAPAGIKGNHDSGYYLFFDTETTGLPKWYDADSGDVAGWPRIVEIAWMQTDPEGREMQVENHIVKPRGFVIPIEAIRVHGITNERAQEEGEELADVLLRFERAVLSSDTLVAHNMAFDAGVIGAEFLRNNLATTLFSKPKICTMEESTAFCGLDGPYGPKWPRLDQLYSELFHAKLEQSHDALLDVRAAAKCFWELRRRGVL